MTVKKQKKKRPAAVRVLALLDGRAGNCIIIIMTGKEGRRNESIENKRISCVRNWRHCLLFLNLNLFGIHHLSSAAVQNFLIIYFLFNLVLVLLLGIIKI